MINSKRICGKGGGSMAGKRTRQSGWYLLLAVAMLALAVLACGEVASPTPEPPAASEEAEVPEPTTTPEATGTPEPTDTPEPTEIPQPALPVADLEQKWKSLLYMASMTSGACDMLIETAGKVQAGEIDGLDAWGEVMTAGILLKAVEETLDEWEPTPDQVSYKADIQGCVSTAQEVVGQWLDDEITSADVPGLLEDTCAASRATVEDVIAAMRDDGLSEGEIAALLDELVQTFETVGEEGEEPTGEVSGLEVRAGREYLSYGYLHIVGEVVNETDDWLEYVKVVATYYDADGKMIGTDYTYTALDMVGPRDVGVFDLSGDVGGMAADVDSYKLQVEADPTSEIPYQDLEVTVFNEYEDYGYYHLVGEVENTGDLDCEYVEIVAGFYDADGSVVAADFTYTALDVVAAGGSSPFDLSAGEVPEFDHYKVWVEGMPVRD
jgi:hypothetical protein